MITFSYDNDRTLSMLWALRAKIQEEVTPGKPLTEGDDVARNLGYMMKAVTDMEKKQAKSVSFDVIASAFYDVLSKHPTDKDLCFKLLDAMRTPETNRRIDELKQRITEEDKQEELPDLFTAPLSFMDKVNEVPIDDLNFLNCNTLEAKKKEMVAIMEDIQDEVRKMQANGRKQIGNDPIIAVFKEHASRMKSFPSLTIYLQLIAPLVGVSTKPPYYNLAQRMKKESAFRRLEGYPENKNRY